MQLLQRWTLVGIGLCTLGIVGCSGGSAQSTSDDDGWTGQTDIEAIFEASCSGCHSTQWSSCWNVQANAELVDQMVSSGEMPQGGGLSPSDESTVTAWLRKGAPCSGTKPAGEGSSGGVGGGGPPSIMTAAGS